MVSLRPCLCHPSSEILVHGQSMGLEALLQSSAMLLVRDDSILFYSFPSAAFSGFRENQSSVGGCKRWDFFLQ